MPAPALAVWQSTQFVSLQYFVYSGGDGTLAKSAYVSIVASSRMLTTGKSGFQPTQSFCPEMREEKSSSQRALGMGR